jgi:3',5'-cyclic AMP phosphodiesterase CpdA
VRSLLHISDIHFGPKHLPEVSVGLRTLVEDRRPDLVVISGDLTQRAKARQFIQARHFVDQLPVPTIAVPGNHDVPMFRFWERLVSPFSAYRRHFAAEMEPVWMDDELLVVGLNTAFNWTIKNGRLLSGQLERLRHTISTHGEGRARILVAHHPMVAAPNFRDRKVLRRAPVVLDQLADLGLHLVLSGHLHISFLNLWPQAEDGERPPFAIVHTGTSASSRGRGWERGMNTCNWLEIDAAGIHGERLSWDAEAGGFVSSPMWRLPRTDGGMLSGDIVRPGES